MHFKVYDKDNKNSIRMSRVICHSRVCGFGRKYSISSSSNNEKIGEICTPLYGKKIDIEYHSPTNLDAKILIIGASLLIKRSLVRQKMITFVAMMMVFIGVLCGAIIPTISSLTRKKD